MGIEQEWEIRMLRGWVLDQNETDIRLLEYNDISTTLIPDLILDQNETNTKLEREQYEIRMILFRDWILAQNDNVTRVD